MLALGVSLLQLQMFFLVFLRTGAFLMALPLVNSPSVPVFFRIGLTFVASLLVFPVLNPGPLPFLADAFSLAVAAAGEILLGVLAGMSIRLVFDGVQLAGQLMGYQMGISIAEVLDPATEDQVALLSQFISLMATLIFLIINGHHAFIRVLVQSYELVPPLGFHVNGSVLEGLVRLTAEMFIIGLKAGSPVVVALMLGTVAFGLVARAVPQMNIFVVSMPLNIAVGLIFLGLSLPHMGAYIGDLLGGVPRHAVSLLKAVP
ncbi:MAG: flagellar biosynthetic protein FliR [Deltaproteobacteria bacterium]|nr:flagellar biosynthetic protein FliR [Deltaproteobacteria bacterium]